MSKGEAPFTRAHGLTEMEWKVIIARARYGTMALGAEALGITEQTFKNHVGSAIKRKGAASIWDLYQRLGWLVLPFDDGSPAEGKPHPGQAHEFQLRCFMCGENGYVHVSLITDTERVRVVQT